MSLGSILLRPQALAITPDGPDDRAVSALTEFLARFAREVAAGGAGLAIIEEELAVTFDALTAEVEPRLGAIRDRVAALVAPLLETVDDVFSPDAEGTGVEAAVERGQAATAALAAALEGLTTARITAFIGELFDIAETELGLNEAKLRGVLAEMIDRMVARLQADLADRPAAEGAYGRYALGAALKEVRGLLEQDLGVPPLTRDTLLPLVTSRLQALDLDGRLAEAARLVARTNGALDGIPTLGRFFPAPVFGPGNLGAAATALETCWYASWLTRDVRKHPDCADNPDLAGIKFDRISARAMERTAFHSAWISSLAEAGLHFASLERRDVLSNLFNAVFRLLEAALAGLDDTAVGRPVSWGVVSGLTLLGSLEELRLDEWFAPFMVSADLLETRLYAKWVWLVRESTLSTLTLLNRNPNQIEGFAYVLGEIASLLAAAAIPKKQYCAAPKIFLLAFVLDRAFSLAVLVFALLLTRLLSGSTFDEPLSRILLRLPLYERIFGPISDKGFLLGAGQVVAALTHQVLTLFDYLYLLNEGDTDGGTFTARTDAAGRDLKFPGYPERATSPYKLPWEKGKVYFCPQGNQGFFSHTPCSNPRQNYAYDFALDHGDEVLAMRDGVVWRFRESVDDDDHSGLANLIVVLHDTPLAGHDFQDDTGTTVETFAFYLHGKKDGVTAAFGFTPTKESSSPGSGTRVQRGQVIMHANNTGNSAFNHVHVDIRPNVGSGGARTVADFTIPFVFADPDVEGEGGVPKALNWYESDNQKVP